MFLKASKGDDLNVSAVLADIVSMDNTNAHVHTLGHNNLAQPGGVHPGGAIPVMNRNGLWVALDYLGDYDENISTFAEHLIANIDASVALGDIPATKTFIVKSIGREKSQKGLTVLIQDEFNPGEYVHVKHQEMAEKIMRALSKEYIVVCDRFIAIFIGHLLAKGEPVNIEALYNNLPTRPDFTVFLDRPVNTLPPGIEGVRDQFLDLAALRPDFMRRAKCSDAHDDTCDFIWRVCKTRILEWEDHRQNVQPTHL